MLVKNLSYANLPQVQLSDTASTALQHIYQNHTLAVCVVEKDRFVGVLKEESLLNADDELLISNIRHSCITTAVNENEHFLKAVAFAVNFGFGIIPVVDNFGKLVGIIESGSLLQHWVRFMQINEPGATIVLEVGPQQYSFSEICRLVESNDTQITQLNTTMEEPYGKMRITIKTNKSEIAGLIATFQRYEYQVVYYSGEELFPNELKNNYENLMNYLNV